MGHLRQWHATLRRQLWLWVVLVALSIVLGAIFGDWHTGFAIVQTVVLVVLGATFVGLIVAGFVELWQKRSKSGD